MEETWNETLLLQEEPPGSRGLLLTLDGSFSKPSSFHSLWMVQKGNLWLSGEEEALRPGDFFLLPAQEDWAGTGEGACVLVLLMPDRAFYGEGGSVSLFRGRLRDREKAASLTQILTSLLLSQLKASSHAPLLRDALWKAFHYQVLNTFPAPEGVPPSGRLRGERTPAQGKGGAFGEILQILETDYAQKLSLQELAKQFYYTPSHLSKLFVRETGMTFSQYLTDIRLEKAMPMLLQTGIEISLLSDRAGFPNQRSFQQAFQKKYHVRPSQYRNERLVSLLPAEDGTLCENIRRARDQGLLAMLPLDDMPSSKAFGQQGTPLSLDLKETLDYGSFSLSEGEEISVAAKNCVLTVDRARDLLLGHVQEKVRMLARDLGYTFLTCHGFLANDLQIASVYRTPPGISLSEEKRPQGKRLVQYDFSLYESILGFVQSTGLRMIIQLSYVPSILAPPGAEVDPVHRSCICMPQDMEEWNRYIRQLFTFLSSRFGPWLSTCRVTLWQVPDVHCLILGKVSPEDFFHLYENTFRTIREVVPDLCLESPTIGITQMGLKFQRLFLTACKERGCLPAAMNYTHYYRGSKSHAFRDPFIESAGFVAKTRETLKTLGLPDLPLNLLEYTYGFGNSPICDAMAGACFPLHMVIENYSLFQDFGYYSMCDYTTGRAGNGQLFSGGHGILTSQGTRKGVYYSFLFLCRMGNLCLGKRGGLLITRKEHSVQILLYYDIPPSEWKEELPLSPSFYEGYKGRRVLFTLSHLPAEELLIRESWLNYQEGSAYEEWLQSGEALLPGEEQTPYSSLPRVLVRRERAQGGSYSYQASMLPFEIRLVEVSWEQR